MLLLLLLLPLELFTAEPMLLRLAVMGFPDDDDDAPIPIDTLVGGLGQLLMALTTMPVATFELRLAVAVLLSEIRGISSWSSSMLVPLAYPAYMPVC